MRMSEKCYHTSLGRMIINGGVKVREIKDIFG